jgi:hypothetical protein
VRSSTTRYSHTDAFVPTGHVLRALTVPTTLTLDWDCCTSMPRGMQRP